MAERKNKNQGFKQLRVWQNAIELFVLVNKTLKEIPYEHSKSRVNTLDACHSIKRNISEGYCRKSAGEYLYFLNFSLGSAGELNSSMIAYHKAELISDEIFENFDQLHYKLENALLKLAASIQEKINKGDEWDQNY
jgi:four helix bundle protein